MSLWKRGRRYWTIFKIHGVLYRKPLCRQGESMATTNWQEATRLEKAIIEAANHGQLSVGTGPTRLTAAVTEFLEAKRATAASPRTVEFIQERLAIVQAFFGDTKLSLITPERIEAFQVHRRKQGTGNRTINMDVGSLRQVLKRFGHWRRLEDRVTLLSESGGDPIGRALTSEEQARLFTVAAEKEEWQHVYCAALLANNTSMRGVEVRHIRRRDVVISQVAVDGGDPVDQGLVHIRRSKNDTSKRVIPLNDAALLGVKMILARADILGHIDPYHYLWCASRHHKFDPTKPAAGWRTAWVALREAAGLPGFRFHDLRHTVITELLEAGVPDHVAQSITGHISKRMLEHYSHTRIKAKRQALDALHESRKA